MSEQTKNLTAEGEPEEMKGVLDMTWAEFLGRLEDALNDGFTPGDKPDLSKLSDTLEKQLGLVFGGEEIGSENIDGDSELEIHVSLPCDPDYEGPIATVTTTLAFYYPGTCMCCEECGCEECKECEDEEVAVTPLTTLLEYLCIRYSYDTGYTVGLDVSALAEAADMAEGDDIPAMTIGDYVSELEDLFIEEETLDLLSMPPHIAASIVANYCAVTGLCIDCSDEEDDEEEEPGEDEGDAE